MHAATLPLADEFPPRRAAIYVRMSSRPQDHSIEHQCDKLYQYAEEHGIEIVKIYADAGKSGLCINGRDGMQQLILDVQAQTAEFVLVLVYDVSRWGRFQDTDESAYYEYICRQAGIHVVYCAEQFENDGSAIASILKGIKRTMAAEYSRELSAKVFAAQCKYAAQGYKMGGFVGYGLRRISYDRAGNKRRTLLSGERKAAATDRVRYCWGPPKEVEVVRRIYYLYLVEKLGDTRISELLNAEKIPGEAGRKWTPFKVKSILTNEKYMGSIVFNRRSAKLKSAQIMNPREAWVCIDDGLPAMISAEVFQQAIQERSYRLQPWGREELLGLLRSLHQKYGRVTAEIIQAEPGYPAPRYFKDTFGSLADSYLFAGLPVTKTLQYARTKHAVRQLLHATTAAVKLLVKRAGGVHASIQPRWRFVLRLNDQITLKVVVARSRHDNNGRIRWRIPIRTEPVPDFVLCVQMDIANVGVMAYYLIPVVDFIQGHIILRAEFPDDKAEYRHQNLASVFGGDGPAACQ